MDKVFKDFKDILEERVFGFDDEDIPSVPNKGNESVLYIKINMKGKDTSTIIRILNDIAEKIKDGAITANDDYRINFK